MPRMSNETLQTALGAPLEVDLRASVLRRMHSGLDRSAVTLDRSDIHFYNVAPDRVHIQITLRNRRNEWSAPTQAVVSAAPLGAFVRWQPLTTLRVPPLAPRGSTMLHTEAIPLSSRTPPVGPGGWSSATDAEEPQRRDPEMAALRARFLVGMGLGTADAALWLPAAPDGWSIPERIHWAGNLNVFVGDVEVERHMALQLRVLPGRTNGANFLVGDGPDEYAFDLAGDVEWPAELMLWPAVQGRRVQLGTWIAVRRRTLLQLLITPPEQCEAGHLDVHVRQRSTGREAVVEFGFDPRAVGQGCYKL
jgi:hypothetical protein